MSGAGVRIGVGTRVMYDGALHEVTEWLPTVSGTDVVLCGPSSVCRMSVVELVSSARVRLLLETAGPESTDDIVPAAVLLSSLSKEELAEVRGKAAHVREVLTGFRALFVFIGADPNTAWLAGAIELDDHGYVPTGPAALYSDTDGNQGRTQRQPMMLETSQPGVFAAGDVRSGSVKRVASAVGEGSMAIRQIHEYFGT